MFAVRVDRNDAKNGHDLQQKNLENLVILWIEFEIKSLTKLFPTLVLTCYYYLLFFELRY